MATERMRLPRALATAALMIVAASGTARAQAVEPAVALAAVRVSMDEGWAADRGLAPDGWALNFPVEAHLWNYLAAGLEFGFLAQKDRRAMQQSTTGGVFDTSAQIWTFGLHAGVRLPLWLGKTAVVPSVRAGAMGAHGKRVIGNCVDCLAQDLALEAGNFVDYRFELKFGTVGVAAGYRQFGPDSHYRNFTMLLIEASPPKRQ